MIPRDCRSNSSADSCSSCSLKSACGTLVDGDKIEPHRPVSQPCLQRPTPFDAVHARRRNFARGGTVQFGEDPVVYRLQSGGSSDAGMAKSSAKRKRVDQGSVRCRHILVPAYQLAHFAKLYAQADFDLVQLWSEITLTPLHVGCR